MTFDFQGRLERLKDSMSQNGVDVVLLSVGADLPYFTGYEAMASERLTVLVVRSEGFCSPRWKRPAWRPANSM